MASSSTNPFGIVREVTPESSSSSSSSSSSGGYTAAYMEAGVRDDLLWRLQEDRQQLMLYQHYRESIPRPRTRRYIHRSRADSHNQLWEDYFSPTRDYPAEFFR